MHVGLAAIAIISVAAFLSMVGCAPNQQYRTNLTSTDANDPKALIESTCDYKLGFVEFDDQGWYWDERQRQIVEKMIRAQAGIDPDHPATPSPILLVTFVHGWKNNADHDNFGVLAFRQILCQLSAGEKIQTQHTPRKVVGVYVGWRGLTASWEPFKEFTFWGRLDTAQKVGGYGAMTKLLVELEGIQKESLAALPKDSTPTEFVIIGHSMGAAAVYSALAQIITERFVKNLEHGRRLKPLGDQVIFLNPAFEAQRHFDLYQMAKDVQKFPWDQRPVLSVFTSRGDWATRYVFPMGRFFSTLFDANRNDYQATAGRETIGWFDDFQTHNVVYNATTTHSETQATTLNPTSQTHEYHTRNGLSNSIQNIESERNKWHPNGLVAQTYKFDDCILKPIVKPKDGFRPGSPFIIASLDKQIMADHTDLTNKVLINFLRNYIQFCRNDHSPDSTTEPAADSKSASR